MATDQNGTPFYGEIEGQLDLLGVEDDDTRDAVRAIWATYAIVLAHERERLMPEADTDR